MAAGMQVQMCTRMRLRLGGCQRNTTETRDGEKDTMFAVPVLCVLLQERCGGESILLRCVTQLGFPLWGSQHSLLEKETQFFPFQNV